MFLRVSDPEGDDYVSVVHRRRVIVHDADDVLVLVIVRGTDFEVGGCGAQIQSPSPKPKKCRMRPRFMSIMHQSNEKGRHHVYRVDPGDRGYPSHGRRLAQVECNLGSSFYRKYKKDRLEPFTAL